MSVAFLTYNFNQQSVPNAKINGIH